METRTLESVAGFLLIDLPDAETSVGPVRLGTKLIPSNATNYARELTYAFATIEQRRGGMTLGLKVDPDARDAAISSVADELAADLAAGRLVCDPGLRMARSELGALAAGDPRSDVLRADRDGIGFEDELIGLGAAVVAEQLVGLDGTRVAIEGLSDLGIAIAREVERRGGVIARVSTAAGCVTGSFTAAELQAALAEHGKDAPTALGAVEKPWIVWRGSDVGAIFCGSAPGVLSATGAPFVGDTPVIATGVAPVATKALAMLRTAGSSVVPAFIASSGALAVAFADDAASTGDVVSTDAARTLAEDTVRAVCAEVKDHADGIYVGACLRAEAFMGTWAAALPFGRPMA